jgi:hypothetical protein
MSQNDLLGTSVSDEQLSVLAGQLREAQLAKNTTVETLAQAAVGAIARAEGAALEARILTRFLTDM